MGVLLIHLLIHLVNSFWVAHRRNYKDTHRNKPENYFVALLVIMVVWLIRGVLLIRQFLDSCI